jgi:hypothetical protein
VSQLPEKEQTVANNKKNKKMQNILRVLILAFLMSNCVSDIGNNAIIDGSDDNLNDKQTTENVNEYAVSSEFIEMLTEDYEQKSSSDLYVLIINYLDKYSTDNHYMNTLSVALDIVAEKELNSASLTTLQLYGYLLRQAKLNV